MDGRAVAARQNKQQPKSKRQRIEITLGLIEDDAGTLNFEEARRLLAYETSLPNANHGVIGSSQCGYPQVRTEVPKMP